MIDTGNTRSYIHKECFLDSAQTHAVGRKNLKHHSVEAIQLCSTVSTNGGGNFASFTVTLEYCLVTKAT